MQNSELFLNGESQSKEYQCLKEDLLSGVRTAEEVCGRLLGLDQATTTRDAADYNLKFLQDVEITAFVEAHPEVQEGYYKFLSLTEIHVAQRLAFSGQDTALDHFKATLAAGELANQEDWGVAYIEGTILYMQGKKIPDEIIERAREAPRDRNIQILENFNKGLAERGFPSYSEDFLKS